MSLLSRLLNVFRPNELERELDDEVRFHLDQQIARNLRQGMDEGEATAAARRQFGDVIRTKREMREVRMMNRKVVGAFALGVTIGALGVALLWSRARPTAQPMQAQQFYRVGQEGVSMPKLLHEVKPKYTPEAMQAKVAGTVIMECIVQPTGVCEDVYVTKPLDPGLDREAVNSLHSWRFQPGERLGKPVPVLVTIQMSFTLR
ncbi:MAG TPA: TonB family protein [Vicinamibacterales bacterium]|jgi:TonB family protein|nr:TonB family protein [Vicinamibacterales bacterium]